MDLMLRFLIGGVVVSAFSVLGDMLKPKSFAGIFGAAPSVALATLGLTFMKEGGGYVATEGRSMIAGAGAFVIYNLVVGWLLMRRETKAWIAAGAAWVLWVAIALGLWALFLR